MKNIIILTLALLSCNPSAKNEDTLLSNFEGKVVGIKDGDTFNVMCEGKERTIRLSHIDCPERKQPFGSKAKMMASDLCFGRMVTVVSKGETDRYKRLIAEVYVGDICINKELVRQGLAWHFLKYSTDTTYERLEKQARQKKIGLWNDAKQTPPWEWRQERPLLHIKL